MPSIKTTLVRSEDREDFFTLKFKTLRPPIRHFTLHTTSVRTVAQVKRHLSRVSNIPQGQMRLVLGGKGLVDQKLIGDYRGVHDGSSVIQIISKPAAAATGTGDQTPVSEAEQMEVMAEQMNPLSNALEKDEPHYQQQQQQQQRVLRAAGEESSSEEESRVLNQQTLAKCKEPNGALRNSLRTLLHTHLPGRQAELLDTRLDNEFFNKL